MDNLPSIKKDGIDLTRRSIADKTILPHGYSALVIDGIIGYNDGSQIVSDIYQAIGMICVEMIESTYTDLENTRAAQELSTRNNHLQALKKTLKSLQKQLDQPVPLIIGHKHLSPEDPVFTGHFPGNPVCPAHWMLEMMYLTAAMFYYCQHGNLDVLPQPINTEGLKNRIEAKPNDTLFIVASKPRIRKGKTFNCSVEIINQNGKTVTSIENVEGLLRKIERKTA